MLSPTGRWGGRVTSRALPDATDELASLDPSLARALTQLWWMQSATELRVATSFAIVHEALGALGAEPALVALAARAVDDEHRHRALCLELAARYAGRAVEPPPALPPQQPAHALAASEDERRALFVIGQCALNETFASAYLTTAHRGATSPLARAALHELLRDEVDHARLGWAYVSTLPAARRAAISDWLVPLTIANLREWRASAASHTEAYEAHGVPRAEAVRAALDEVVREVLVPGFAHAGLDVRGLERWARAGLGAQSEQIGLRSPSPRRRLGLERAWERQEVVVRDGRRHLERSPVGPSVHPDARIGCADAARALQRRGHGAVHHVISVPRCVGARRVDRVRLRPVRRRR
jgi:hypothetical protein